MFARFLRNSYLIIREKYNHFRLQNNSMKLRLKRELGLLEATIYGVGIILGAGIYALIGKAAGLAGNSLWLSFLIGAVVSSITGLSYAELSAMYPKSAGEFVYVKKAYGSKLFAFLIGWLLIFTGVVSAATVSLGFAGYFKELFNFPIIPTAILLILAMSFVNFWGIKESSNLNIMFTAVEVFGLLLIILLGIGGVGKINIYEMPMGLSGVFSAAALIFFAYIGFEDIVNIAEETKSPRKNIPIALILAIAITAIIYILTSLAAVSLASWQELSTSDAPLALAASKALGPNAFTILSYVALFATTNTVLIILVVTSRMVYGMARDRSLPRILAKIHPRRKTPVIAVVAAMILTIGFVLIGDIKLVASVTSLGIFITFLTINMSLIHLRYTKPNLKRPFKVPLNIGKYPVIAFFGVFTCLFMILQFDYSLIQFGLIILAIGAVLHELWIKYII
jgi:APA family basic amino acid/polyamine antiporter